MEVKKYNPFIVQPKTKPKQSPKAKTKPKPKTKLEARGLTLENKKKLDTIYAKGFVKTSRKNVSLRYNINHLITITINTNNLSS